MRRLGLGLLLFASVVGSAGAQIITGGATSGSGTVTSVATTSPLTGGPVTTTGTIACATCVTSAAALTSGQLVAGAGSQASAVTDLTGDVTTSGGVATTLLAKQKVRMCLVLIGDPGAASAVLADDNDSPVACANEYGAAWTITTVACWANAGSPTVTPILTGGSGTSILTGALTCGTAAWAAGTVQGTAPVVNTFSGAGATCAATPCTIDVNITTAGGTAKYLVVKIVGTI
jgi:hypothetical protein